MDEQLVVYLLIAGSVAAVTLFFSRFFVSSKDAKLRERLVVENTSGQNSQNDKQNVTGEGAVPMLQRIGSAAAQPFMPTSREKVSSLRRDLGYAGIYAPS